MAPKKKNERTTEKPLTALLPMPQTAAMVRFAATAALVSASACGTVVNNGETGPQDGSTSMPMVDTVVVPMSDAQISPMPPPMPPPLDVMPMVDVPGPMPDVQGMDAAQDNVPVPMPPPRDAMLMPMPDVPPDLPIAPMPPPMPPPRDE